MKLIIKLHEYERRKKLPKKNEMIMQYGFIVETKIFVNS